MLEYESANVQAHWTDPGMAPQTGTNTTSGSYSIDGSKITFKKDVGEDESATFSLRDNRLILEDDEQIMIFEKK